MNEDGINDVLSGCYSQHGHGGMVGSFWVFFGSDGGRFAKPVELLGTDGKLLQVHCECGDDSDMRRENICTRPFAFDWNGDGRLDIVTGNFAGTFYLFTGEGKGKFRQNPTILRDHDGAVLKSTAHSDPYFVDWDRDGDLDLIVGTSDGEVHFAENLRNDKIDQGASANDRTPLLAPFRLLVGQFDDGPDSCTRVCVADLNGDGKLDLVVGDRFETGGELRDNLSAVERTRLEAVQARYDEASKEYYKRWTAYYDMYEDAVKEAGAITGDEQKKLRKELVDDKVQADEAMWDLRNKMSDARGEMAEFMTPIISGGNVWTITQK